MASHNEKAMNPPLLLIAGSLALPASASVPVRILWKVTGGFTGESGTRLAVRSGVAVAVRECGVIGEGKRGNSVSYPERGS